MRQFLQDSRFGIRTLPKTLRFTGVAGDFAIAFATHPSLRVTGAAGPQAPTMLPTERVSGLFEAVLDATEEALYNSVLRATDVTGKGRSIRAIPVEPLQRILVWPRPLRFSFRQGPIRA